MSSQARQVKSLSLHILALVLLFLIAEPVHSANPVHPSTHEEPPYNVLLITPDQLRADFMHTYGYSPSDTPNIDRLAKRGTTFTHAYSAGSWTTPSFGTIFTGLFPTVHGMTLPPYQGCGQYITHPMVGGEIPAIPPEVNLSRQKEVLSELLKQNGMVTAADDANCWSLFDIVSRGWDSFKFFPGYQLPVEGHPDYRDPSYLTV